MSGQGVALKHCTLHMEGAYTVRLHLLKDALLSTGEVRQIFEVIHRTFPQALTLMVTADENASLSQEARELVSHGKLSDQIKADAIVTEHYSHHMAANYFVRQTQPERPTRLFKSQEEALEWLRGFHPK